MNSTKTVEVETKRTAGRNIVLCTDGTGNSGSAASKSNVWRLYQALDQSNSDRQIAFYVRGVGTSSVQLLRLLGGAFGFGLARNVRTMYIFLSENYRPPDKDYEGDRVYIFGFSRGAFTARLLAGLINRCGILDRRKSVATKKERYSINTRRGMDVAAKLAYASFRKSMQQRAPIATIIWRFFRDRLTGVVPGVEEFRDAHCFPLSLYESPNRHPIETLGVWDTVSAYGMPITELSVMLDKLVFSHRFENHKLDQQTARAYHALAIDDERYSFHPLVFDETEENSEDNRITQVWFPGMHSDVGGGYPDGSLSFVALNWMVDAVKRQDDGDGLDFVPDILNQYTSVTSPLGVMHNSREGLALYYRLAPRVIGEIKHADKELIKIPKIHRSVFDRIKQGVGGYAPLTLPTEYQIVEYDGSVTGAEELESTIQLEKRGEMQERVRHHIFWRRTMYLLSVLFTLLLIAAPFLPGNDSGCLNGGLLEKVTPGYLLPIVAGWCSQPLWTVIMATGLIGTAINSVKVKGTTDSLAEDGWQHLKGGYSGLQPEPRDSLLPGVYEKTSSALRNNKAVNQVYKFMTEQVSPRFLLLAGFSAILFAVVYVTTGLISWFFSGVMALFSR